MGAIFFLLWMSVFVLAISKWMGYFQPLIGKGYTISPKIALGAFSIFFITQFVLVPIVVSGYMRFYQRSHLTFTQQGWLNVLLIAFLGGALCIYGFLKKNEVSVFFKSSNRLHDISLGLVSWVIGFPLVLLVSNILTALLEKRFGLSLQDQNAVIQIRQLKDDPLLFSATAISIVFIVPIIEEFLFRGFLQSALMNFFSRWKTIVLVSAIFAAFHFSFLQGFSNINIVLSLFVLSLFLGYLKERQGNLMAPAALHIVFNLVSVILILWQINFEAV